MSLPLEGVRVIDLTWWIAGPLATTQMAMMGAEVIRLESASRPDSMRLTTPFADNEPGVNRSGRWNSHNFSKRSAALNLSKPEGAELARRLVAVSDVVFENFAAGVLDRMGLDYDTLRSINPRIILCSVSALGRNGPRANWVGFGPGAIAYSGLAAITGRKNQPPGTVPPFLADYTTAWHAALSVLSAIHKRERTGEGMRIELSMVEAQASHLPEAIIDASLNGRIATTRGNDHPVIAPHGYYRCAGDDRWLAISAATDAQWEALCDVLAPGDSPLRTDARFEDAMSRHEHRDELDRLITVETLKYDAFALEARLQAAGVPAGVALKPPDVYADPHLRARGAFINPAHGEVGPYQMVGLPYKLSDAEAKVAPSPLLGQDSQYVFGELLGVSDEELRALRESGVVA